MEEKKSNIIFLDTVPESDWWFKKNLELKTQKEFTVIYSDTHNMQGKASKFLRYASYFLLPLKGIIHRKKYETIVAWQQFYGLCYAFWMLFWGLKKENKLIVMAFIYKKKTGMVGIFYDKFIRYIVSGKYIDKFICFSEYECRNYADYFGIEKENFASCGLALTDKYHHYKDMITRGDYYLSAGRSNRDYEYLCDEFKNLKENATILCDNFKIDGIPDNIRFYNHVYGDEYFKMLARCRGVIIPLNSDGISAGQLALLQGMMFGKICVITETKTSIEYVENGVNALFINNKKGELTQIIKDIEMGKHDEMGEMARNCYLEKFSGTELAEIVAEAIRE